MSFRATRAAIVALSLFVVAAQVSATGTPEADVADVVHVYSHRHYEADQQIFDRFEAATGLDVQVVQAGASELIERLEAEGDRSPADVLITVDVGRLTDAQSRGLLRPVRDPVIESLVPEQLRAADGSWFAVTRRARVIAYHPDRVDPSLITTYAALGEPPMAGRIAIRTSSNIYNVSLMSWLIERDGADAARAWAEAVSGNLARDPQGNDRDQLRAVAAGDADVAVVNTYYLGLMLASSEAADREVASQLAIAFPDQGNGGTHVNISGAGITAAADNEAGARQLIAFLLSDEAQQIFAQANFEYPVRDGIEIAPEIAALGSFEASDIPLDDFASNAREATVIFDEVGWR